MGSRIDDEEWTIGDVRKHPEDFRRCLGCGEIIKKSDAFQAYGYYFCNEDCFVRYMEENECKYSCGGQCLVEDSGIYQRICNEERFRCEYYETDRR